jgi:cell division protein FtsB
MISLLPYDAKKDIRSARVNVILTRYIVVTLLAFGFLALLLAGSYVVLAQTRSSAQQVIDAGETKAAVYSSTQADVDQLSDNLAETKSILNKEVRYSKVLIGIGQQMPAGTVLEEITLDSNSFTGTPLNLKAYAATNAAAVALRENL